MSLKVRIVSLGLLLGVLFLSGLTNLSAEAQQAGPPGGAPGARSLLESFFETLTAGDLVLLKQGGALSGAVQGDQFQIVPDAGPTSGQPQAVDRSKLAFMSFGDKSDELILTSGDILTGTVQLDSLAMTLPVQTQSQVAIPKAQIAATFFKINLPSRGPGNGPPEGGPPNQQLFQLFRSLRTQNLQTLFAKTLTSYDLAIFPNRQLLSGKIVNQQFVFHSTIFGTLTVKASDLASIQLAPAGSTSVTDFLIFKTGDRISGTLDDQSAVQFQPVALTDAQGQQLTITLQRGNVNQVVFHLPASAFGGGRGPGFQGGPGR